MAFQTGSKSVRKLRLQGLGLLLTSHDLKPKKILASIPVQEAEVNNHEIPDPLTRDFFSKESENVFLSSCADGYSRSLGQNISKPGVDTCETVQYMSKITHTWYPKIWLEKRSDTQIQLSPEALESLKQISSKLSCPSQNFSKSEIKGYVSAFFHEFGSHVSLGPFVIGGRSVEKVSCPECTGIEKKRLWSFLETTFYDMSPHDADICSDGGDSLLVSIETETGQYKKVEFIRKVEVFGGTEIPSDFETWKKNLSGSTLVISGVVSRENVQPVWDVIQEQVGIFGESCEALTQLLEETWFQEYGSSHTLKNSDVIRIVSPTVSTSKVEMNECAALGDTHVSEGEKIRETNLPELLQKLHLSRKMYGLSDATTLRKVDLGDFDNGNKDVLWKFLKLISSLDHRGRTCFKIQPHHVTDHGATIDSSTYDIFEEVDAKETGLDSPNSIISAMDVTFAVLHCCDPFLKQELIWKMAECRLAVPILLCSLDNKERIEFQLWGLRKIYKTWNSRFMNETPLERSVVLHPLPIVSFLRFGDVSFSKSKLLNKILGKLQGNNDHPFFVDMEEERPCAVYSKGTLEVAWFLPEGNFDEKDPNALLDAVTFFNLRGDAMDYPIQKEFACRASDIVVALVEKSKYSQCKRQIQEISEKFAKYLVCVISSSDHQKEATIMRQRNVTMMRTKHHFVTDIGSNICQEMNNILWHHEQSDGRQSKFKTIHSLAGLCNGLGFAIDEQNGRCQRGKRLAENIAKSISQSTGKYKVTQLPLQGKFWKEWASLDKRWCKGYGHQRFDSMEHFHDHLKQEMLSIREKQRGLAPSDDVVTFVDGLQQSGESRQYFIAWLNFYLNDMSQKNLGPLRKEMRDVQNESREINAERSKVRDKPKMSNDDRVLLKKLRDKDASLLERARVITDDLDSGSLGIEHYIREIGQRFEAYEDLRRERDILTDYRINLETLPHIAADLLIHGHPLEILDGDVGRVPITWIKAVFNSVNVKLGYNARVYTISVLGIQSSGKSTLLNSLFGVRFAVSAGRCTRGVFIQLLKVHEELCKETGCNYVIVIDTEGLKAPERVFREDFRHDNELATFALCLADLTLVNIAGQTVGKDMTDVLQIAAHAFIRMKKVHIKSSCRIIQQFVADLAAVDKNEASTLAILTSLDEAIAAAAKDEGYGTLYRRFSDVFNLKRNEDIQYIPSLWQGSMAPPNHRYSEKIMQLKKVIINDLKRSNRKFEQFAERTINVWNAVREENFIFSFQNCVIVLRYKKFQHAYGKWIGEMRQKVMEWESNANQVLKNASKHERQNTKSHLSSDIEKMVGREGEKIGQQILAYLQENVKDDDDQLHKFQDEFLQDLEYTQRNFVRDARETLDRTTDSLRQLNHVDIILTRCKSQLREKARKQAVELRERNANVASMEKVISKQEINAKFEELWKQWMREICGMYPEREVSLNDVEKEFDSYLIRQGERRDLSIGLKNKLGISKGRFMRKASHFVAGHVYESQEAVISTIIENSLGTLQVDIADDLAFDPVIIQKLIDSTIDALNNMSKVSNLTQEDKVNVILEVCEKAIPIIFEGRQDYNSKYSLRKQLEKEKETLEKDFQAIWSNAFQDQRASENLTALLKEKIIEIVLNFLGPAIYKEVRESCSSFRSKFTMMGRLLEEMARKEDFRLYYQFLFELDQCLENFCLQKTAEFCSRGRRLGKSFVETIARKKVADILNQLFLSVTSTMGISNNPENDKSSYSRLLTWVNQFEKELQRYVPALKLSDDDVRNLLLFDVDDLDKFERQVKKYIERHLMDDIINELHLPPRGNVKKTMKLLKLLPLKPHEELKRHISGCTAQCPICHTPCDNMTKRHEKHRAELHFPEGLIGGAKQEDERLTCSICTSSVTTNDFYWDGKTYRRYCDYQKDFPEWVIQPVQNDSPLKYWQWVMKRFNEDFAQLYSREKAELPAGWKRITKDQAIKDLKEAYRTKEVL